VISIRHDPFPFEPARDLLGVVRALYAAAKARGADVDRLRVIAALGCDRDPCVLSVAAHGRTRGR